MPYVARNAEGQIVAVSLVEAGGATEHVEADSRELHDFLSQMRRGELTDTLEWLVESDLKMVRVLEDLIDVLIQRNVINFTDLPLAAKNKLLQRRSLRESLDALKLIGDEGQELI